MIIYIICDMNKMPNCQLMYFTCSPIFINDISLDTVLIIQHVSWVSHIGIIFIHIWHIVRNELYKAHHGQSCLKAYVHAKLSICLCALCSEHAHHRLIRKVLEDIKNQIAPAFTKIIHVWEYSGRCCL